MTLQDVQAPITGTCEYGASNGRKEFADAIKLRILRWGDDPGLSRWAQYNHKHPY